MVHDSHALAPSLFPCLKKGEKQKLESGDKSFVNSSKNKEKIMSRINNLNS
jgi:hypothetical protein